MSFLLLLGGGVALVGLVGWYLYVQHLHPAWRKERRVIRACQQAFDDESYTLIRLQAAAGTPSIGDLFFQLSGSSDASRYFTYRVETDEGEKPDFTGMSRQDVGRVRRYLRRSEREVAHHGRRVLHPE